MAFVAWSGFYSVDLIAEHQSITMTPVTLIDTWASIIDGVVDQWRRHVTKAIILSLTNWFLLEPPSLTINSFQSYWQSSEQYALRIQIHICNMPVSKIESEVRKCLLCKAVVAVSDSVDTEECLGGVSWAVQSLFKDMSMSSSIICQN